MLQLLITFSNGWFSSEFRHDRIINGYLEITIRILRLLLLLLLLLLIWILLELQLRLILLAHVDIDGHFLLDVAPNRYVLVVNIADIWRRILGPLRSTTVLLLC